MQVRRSIIALAALIISGCGFYGWSTGGKVVTWDKKTIKKIDNMLPVSDVFIKVKWYGIVPRPADASGYCYKVKIVKADNIGNFDSGSAWMMPKLYPVFNMSAAVTVYKPGYQEHVDHSFPEDLHILVEAEEILSERLFRLNLYSDVKECKEVVSDKNLEDYLAAIFYEAKSLPIEDIEKDFLYQDIKKLKDEFSRP